MITGTELYAFLHYIRVLFDIEPAYMSEFLLNLSQLFLRLIRPLRYSKGSVNYKSSPHKLLFKKEFISRKYNYEQRKIRTYVMNQERNKSVIGLVSYCLIYHRLGNGYGWCRQPC